MFPSVKRSFLTDSSGTYTEYKAVSIGAGCEGATDMLKDLYKPVPGLFVWSFVGSVAEGRYQDCSVDAEAGDEGSHYL